VPASLRDPGALRFWLAVVLTGVAAGVGAALLTLLFKATQELAWGASDPAGLLEQATQASAWRHVGLLLLAGLLTGGGQ
jgi:CIC family chloride channel protein